MRGIRFTIHLLVVIASVNIIFFVAKKCDEIRPNQELQEFLYLAKNNEIKSFAFGFESEYADVLWMLSIQAFRQYCIEKVPFSEAKQVYQSIARLDPHFEGMYETACIYINMVEKKALPGVEFIENSLQQQPSLGVKYPKNEKLSKQPWMWYLLGRIYCLQRLELQKKDGVTIKETMRKAVHCMDECLKLSEGKHPGAQFFAYFLVRLDQGFSFDLLTWLQIYSGAEKNEVLRGLILETLQELISQVHLSSIRQKFKGYYQKHGVYPQKLEQCMAVVPVEPIIENMPKIAKRLLQIITSSLQKRMKANEIEILLNNFIHKQLLLEFPLGKSYIVSGDKILSFTIEKKYLEKQIRGMQIMVDRFKKKLGYFPKNLQEVVEKSGLPKLNPLPLNRKYTYNPKTGEVGNSE
ncbi:hypothetical protein [Candidatus Uabimicrobium sp. HlEnr_7]|uniref:hypothetical protein n=1 Tax=Candidatus Uabimicrobium helgolandensis TaxID=3095367 RepID=UPI00355749A6